jgi:tetratricopeptide (TPR) repeat protein
MTATAELRASTAQEIGQKGVPAESVDVKNILDAEQKFLRAKMLINRGQGFDEAFNLLSDVIEISRNEPEYRIYYNWSLWLVRGQTDAIVSRAVVKEIHDAMKDHPDENGYMFLGHIYKALGDAPKCEESFKKVLQINPENHSAQVELKMLQKRR